VSNNINAQSTPQQRIASLDALRGFAMFCIAGGAWRIMDAIHTVWPSEVTNALNAQFDHVPWAGFHLWDLVFPLFLFVAGAALPLSLTRRMEQGAHRRDLYLHVVQRSALLFFFGLVFNGLLGLNIHNIRLPGVLQRIAICYLVAALVVMNTGVRGQASVTAAILIGYWLIMWLVPVPGVPHGAWSTPEGNLAGYLDRHIIRYHLCCYDYGDNEGLLATLPAIATTLLGTLAGHALRSEKYLPNQKSLSLAAAGVGSLFLGWVWSLHFPIIKNIWSSSYVLWAAGWSLLLLAFFYWAIDMRGYHRWAFFLKVIGMNAITIYMASGIVDWPFTVKYFLGGLMSICGSLQPLIFALGMVSLRWLFLYFLYRQKIFLRV